MLKQKDLEAAVAAGIISEDQVDALNDFAAQKRTPRGFAVGKDERFKLLGGLNDFFVAIGVVMLGFSVWYGAATFDTPAGFLVGIFLMWALAEYLTAKLRLTAPSIVISILLPLFAWLACKGLIHNGLTLGGVTETLPALAAIAMASVHYIRFRLPFTMAVLAICVFVLLLKILGVTFDASQTARNQAIIFSYGLALFGLAMWFDKSDTERLTRRADKGFWLHLVAAPMIAHPLISYLSGGTTGSGEAAIIVILVAALLATVALLIDRRALVVVSLSYLAGAIAYGVTQLSNAQNAGTKAMFTLLLLGAIIVSLGVGWHRLRHMLMRALPNSKFKSYLPPINEGS